MSDIIQLLPDSVANQIAAGEVIQRPASVIKELVENAVDAGATVINVVVVDAGRTSIQVVDNGKGMSETDARLSFERHATSKIRKADDLFALTTMGFRGEALASIAAVAQVELKTRLRGEDIGTHLSIAGSRFVGQEPCSCPEGSNFLVENLFYNVPARRKFLKSNATELNHILTAFERIALVNPDIAFTLHSNGTELFNLKAAGLRQRIIEVFGKRLNQDLLPVNVDTSLCKIHGFVGKPEAARKKGAHQYFFVNGRYMKHPYFSKAVMTAFDRLIPTGEQVPFFIYFEVEPQNIDVNIHPVKTEVKFESEQAIWQILLAAVKEAVGLYHGVPSIEFDTQGRPDIPVFSPDEAAKMPRVDFNPQYNPFKSTPDTAKKTPPRNWEDLYGDMEKQSHAPGDLFETQADSMPVEEKSPLHYQYKGRYVLTAVRSGLMIIDQHRAHVRILYEQYKEQLRERQPSSQKLLFPEVVDFPPSLRIVLEKVLPELEAMGFELTPLGGESYAVNAVPAGLEGIGLSQMVTEMVATAAEVDVTLAEQIDDSLALSMARHAAIPYGQVLSNEEMESIINSLFACKNSSYTPDGKNILCILRQEDMENMLH